MKKIIFCGVLLLGFLLFSCSKGGGLWYSDNWEKSHPTGQSTCDTSTVVSFSVTVKPIITQNCAISGCHVSHGGAGASDYNQFANVQTDAFSGVFMERVDLPTSNSLHMPQGSSNFLITCDTLKIKKWIRAGCPNN